MDGVNHGGDQDGDLHVMPNFGRPHEDSTACWCTPRPDPESFRVWIHEVEQ